MKVLIIGAQGYLGQNYFKAFTKAGYQVSGTGRRDGENIIQFDLGKSPVTQLEDYIEKGQYVLLLASIPKISTCQNSPEETKKVNVSATQEIIDFCIKKEAIPVFSSSDIIFGGESEYYNEQSVPRPLNKYAEQKNQIEKFLISNYSENQYLILRLSKVYSLGFKDGTLLNEMAKKLHSGVLLSEAYDQVFCPIWVEDLMKATLSLFNKQARGLYNVCGAQGISRYQMAISLASKMGISEDRVRKCSIDDIDPSSPRPHNTSMDCSKLRSFIDIAPIELDKALEQTARLWSESSEIKHQI